MFNQNRILRVFKLITLLKTYPAKSIKRLAASLEISERSCYRYMDLLAELGFEVRKDDHNKFFLQEKLPYLEESNILATNIVHGHLAKLLARINEAIKEQKQVILHKYQSASSESIADRLVEPIGFTANYTYLCAYEPADAQNKYFKLERMGSIEILAETYKFKEAHVLLTPDVFGFNDSGEKFPIKLKLTMRAMLFLKDDYPATADYLSDQKDGSWLLEVEVNSMEPVERILRGMPGEVEMVLI